MKNSWPTKKISDCTEKLPKKSGIPLKKYLKTGEFPIIDQGQDFIGGYTDNSVLVYADNFPVVVFGDHTRAIKFIDFPFAVGADGTKVLKPKDFLDTKYFYFALMSLNIESRGYARHFRILKEKEIPLPPIAEQKKIVAKLEGLLGKIKEAKRLRAEAQEAAQNLLPAELYKIFTTHSILSNHSLIRANRRIVKKSASVKNYGEAQWEEKELGDVFVFNYGKGLSRLERSESGKYIVYGANGELGRSDKYLIEGDGIIVGRKGSAGEVTRAMGKYWPTDVTYFITGDKKYDISFAYYLFKFLNFSQYAVGVKPGINRKQIYGIKIPLPPVDEQKKIVARLDSLSEKIKNLRQTQAETAENLKSLEQSVLHQAFSNSRACPPLEGISE